MEISNIIFYKGFYIGETIIIKHSINAYCFYICKGKINKETKGTIIGFIPKNDKTYKVFINFEKFIFFKGIKYKLKGITDISNLIKIKE